MTRTCLVAGLTLLIASAIPLLAADPRAFRVVGYLPDYRTSGFDPASALGITDLIIFSAELAENGDLDLARLKNTPWKKLRAFKTHGRVRLILCVGGWERSKHFAAVASSEAKRKVFVQAAIKLCLAERLDGIDLDWEHPKDLAEEQAYAKLLSDLRTGFEPHGLTLSVTMAGWQHLPKEAFSSLDWVQLMAYDHDGKHSTFAGAKADVKRTLEAGAPAHKIVLGLPFYGRHEKNRNQVLTYKEIVAQHHPKQEIDEIAGLYFNGPSTIRLKTEYALDSQLGGVMIWELGQDASGSDSLLKVIDETIRTKKKLAKEE